MGSPVLTEACASTKLLLIGKYSCFTYELEKSKLYLAELNINEKLLSCSSCVV